MSLSSDLLSQFVKITKDDKKVQNEATVYGTVKTVGDKTYVQLDGSDLLTPVATTADVKEEERVTVMIKNHTATISGNLSSPSASSKDLADTAREISEFEIVMSYKVTAQDLEAANATIESLRAKLAQITDLEAVNADIENLQAKFADLEYVNAGDIKAITAEIEKLEATFGTFTDISAEDLEALNAHITTLKGYTADFTYVSAEVLEAVKASIKQLDVKKLNTDDADIRFANIDFANITELAVENLNSKWGLIKDLTSEDGVFTGELVGVTIKGDLIEGGTIKADTLIIKDSKDGLYYKLNFESGNFTDSEEIPEDGIHGKAIIAKSLTADQINVSDLIAFGAKIGGFNIADGAIYSGTKASVDNATRGVYLDNDGQINLGDSTYFLKYFKETSYVRSDEESDVGDGILLNDVLTTSNDPVYVHTDDEGVKSYFTVVGEVYYKVAVEEKYKLAISAESVWFGNDGKTSADDIRKLTEHVKIGNITETSVHKVVYDDTTGMYATEEVLVKNLVAQYITATKVDGVYTVEGHEVYLGGDFGTEYVCFVKDTNPSVELAEGDSDFKQVITNKKTMFMDGGTVGTTIDTDGVRAKNLTADKEIRNGQYRWSVRPNGNYRLSWVEEDK